MTTTTAPDANEPLPKAYDPSQVEPRLYAHWEQQGYFKADPTPSLLPVDDPGYRRPYCIVIPPPNVTGSLHMGHAMYVIEDVLIRWHRMLGDNALWLPGVDHAGIATQMVVEKELARTEKKTRHDLGREKFLERVWAWKQQSGNRITTQLRTLGFALDWSRERFTMDAKLSAAVVEVFVKLYEEGLMYRAARLINWCPRCRTALSDLEVEPKEEKGKLWDIAYPLVDGSGEIVVATTRPETLLGDTAVAVHPGDPRYQGWVGKKVRLPLAPEKRTTADAETIGNTIPIVGDAILVDMAFGSGAVKVTPGHDFNDFETGKRHKLPLVNLLNPDGTLNDNAGAYAGKTADAARKEVLKALTESGALRGEKDHVLARGRCQRCDTVVEPYNSTQWYVRAKPLAGPAIRAVETGRTRIIPEGWTKTYMHWMTNIQDWCVSRQLWWGHQIPAWYGPDNAVFVARSEAEAAAAAEKHYGKLVTLRRDDDVLDTWFSSALWPFTTLGWPEKTADLDAYYPGAVLETGFDILFFWVARMMMMGIHFMGEVPFKHVYLHAIVRDDKGEKMSKVKGNVVDPLDVIQGATVDRLPKAAQKQYPEGWKPQGADSLRFTLASMASQGRDIKFSMERIEGYRAFLNKVWNAARFALMRVTPGAVRPIDDVKKDMSPADRWILGRLQELSRGVNTSLKEYRLDEATMSIYHFLWDELCDWYIEMSKPALMDTTASPRKVACEATLVHVLDHALRLLHPFCPYVTEEIWQKLPLARRPAETIQLARFPTGDATWDDPVSAAVVGTAQELCNAVRRIRADVSLNPSKKVTLRVGCTDAAKREVTQFEDALKRLANVEAIEFHAELGADKTKQCAMMQTTKFQVAVPLEGLLDVEAEKVRLAKELEKAEKELAGIRGRLDNAGFRERAPKDIIEKDEARAAELNEKMGRIRDTVSRLN
ncbi:MAG: valine--tRNA ligase [Deltaproteobacteria bacterium]|nr:valine--tRNA ligase [Deltaproteobacteria bacterium]